MQRSLLLSLLLFNLLLFGGCGKSKDNSADFEIVQENGQTVLKKYTGSDKEITIPDGVTEIGDESFGVCMSVNSVVIPNGVTKIGSQAFWCCNALKSVQIPGSVIKIGDSAFRDCGALTSVMISEGVKEIGDRAFENCVSLTSVKIPKSVTEIGSGAFADCVSLTTVKIPESVSEIERDVFRGCPKLTVQVAEGSKAEKYAKKNNISFKLLDEKSQSLVSSKEVVEEEYDPEIDNSDESEIVQTDNPVAIETGQTNSTDFTITQIKDQIVLEKYTGLDEKITIPERVTKIGNYAFSDCFALTSVVIPEGVTEIGWKAFSGCSSLTSVTIPKSVTKIKNEAFSDCTSLTSVVIPEGVTEIGRRAFSGCSSLTSVTIPKSVTKIEGLFPGCSNLTIYAPKGSKAEEYAQKNKISFNVQKKRTAPAEETLVEDTKHIDEDILIEEPVAVEDESQTEDSSITEVPTPEPKGIQNVTVPDDCPTLEEAYAKVKDGGTITIRPGKYKLTKTITIDRTVSFQGSTKRAKDVLIACSTSSAFSITDGSPLFQNLTAISGAELCSGFHVTGGTPKILNCTIISRKGAGMIVIGENANPQVESCIIKDCEKGGLWVCTFARGKFNGCEIYGNKGAGIEVAMSGNPTVIGCKIHDGKSAGVFVNENGLGTFNDCEIYGNALPGIGVKTSGNPIVTWCRIHDGKAGGVYVYEGGQGTFNNNTLTENYTNGKLDNWTIRNDAGEVKGSGNTPEIPEHRSASGKIQEDPIDNSDDWKKAIVARRLISATIIRDKDIDAALQECYLTGKAVWNQLSTQERLNYLGEFSNLNVEDAKAVLGYKLMYKYADGYRRVDFARAAYEARTLFELAEKAGVSETELSRLLEYTKNNMQNKNLAIIALRATLAELAAKKGN